MNFEQNVNKILDGLSMYRDDNDHDVVNSLIRRNADIEAAVVENGGSRQVRRRYKRELLKRITYALWAAQRKQKVSAFPEGRYVPYQAPYNKYS